MKHLITWVSVLSIVTSIVVMVGTLAVFVAIPVQAVVPMPSPTPYVMTTDEALAQIEELFETPPDWKQRMIDEINKESK